MVLIGGLQKSSLIDYPEKISAIIFTQGCNFRCPYCHNPELIKLKDSHLLPAYVSGRDRMESKLQEIFEFLKSRQGKLDGVVITGGEPTLHKDLSEFIKQIKDLGFLVKLDTNGTNPEMLQKLLDENFIDYVAMDIKAPIDKYSQVACSEVNTENILKSIKILKSSNIDYEFRTTVVKSQLSVQDFDKIGKMIKSAKKYYLQRFVPTKTLNRFYINQTTYSDEEFCQIMANLQKYVEHVKLR